MMKILLALLVALLVPTASWAQESCPKPSNAFAVFSGSGNLTTKAGAQRSLKDVAHAVGTTVNGQPASYNLAYNNAESAFADLLLALDAHSTPFTSETMLWLQGQSGVPSWFSDALGRLQQAVYQITASGLQEQVGSYQTAIAHGQKVLVVSPFQGDLYANLARQLLQATGTDLRAFGISAVAAPASMVSDLKTQLVALQDPQPVCDNYRKQFIGLLAGSYLGHCNGSASIQPVSIDANAQVSFPNGIVDLSGPNVTVGAVTRQLVNTSVFGDDNRGVSMAAGPVGGGWSADGTFNQLMRVDDRLMDCQPQNGDGPTRLAAPVDIGAKVGQLLEGYRTGVVARQCLSTNNVTGVVEPQPAWQPVSVRGGTLSIGANSFPLTGAQLTESITITSATSVAPADYEPQFTLILQYPGHGLLLLSYKSLKGLATFTYHTTDHTLSCGLE